MTIPLVSVVMPAYNASQYVRESIESILGQTFTDYELIVIDDGSVDNTVELIRSYNDKRIILIRNEMNLGVTKSLNIGLRRSVGRYIARMDSDDISLSSRLEKQVAQMEDCPDMALCGSSVEVICDDNYVLKYPNDYNEIKCMLLSGPPFAHPSVMIRNSFLRRYNIHYDEKLNRSQDYDMWLRLLSVGSATNIDEVLLQYRKHRKQLSYACHEEQEICADIVRRRVLNHVGVSVCDYEVELLKLFLYDKLDYNKHTADKIASMLNAVYKANRKTSFIDSIKLKEYILYHWKQYIIKRNADNNVNNVSVVQRIFHMVVSSMRHRFGYILP